MTTAEAATAVFGDRLALARRYADWLAGAGIERGLLGPREAERMWDRHILNSAVLAELVPAGASVIDLGSGAGLPGIPLALARPDLAMTLLEPLLRRVTFLNEVVADLSLDVRVTRGRAEDSTLRAGVVVARAVAPLDRLARWAGPLLTPGGELLALKGESAEAEVRDHGALLHALGASAQVQSLVDAGGHGATVVRVRFEGRGR